MSNEGTQIELNTGKRKQWTVLLSAPHIIAAQYISDGTEEGLADRIKVYYGATERPVVIGRHDELFEYYFNHWSEEANKMLNPSEEPQAPVEPVGKEH